jgi:hypothetical protein
MRAAWVRRKERNPDEKIGPWAPGGPLYDPAKAAKGGGGGGGWGGPARSHDKTDKGKALTMPEVRQLEAAGRVEAKTAAEAARPHAVAMVEVWKDIALDPGQNAQARVIAADKLVERAEGKPVQPTISLVQREPMPFDTAMLTPQQVEVLDEVILIALGAKAGAPVIAGEIAEQTEEEAEDVDSSP